MHPRIVLIRHGAIAWSLSDQNTTCNDLPLIAHVLTSPLKRAGRTRELVTPGQPSEFEPDLEEWDHGDYEGQHSAAVHKKHLDWNLFLDGSLHGDS